MVVTAAGKESGLLAGAHLLYRRGAALADALRWLGLLGARLLAARVFLLSGLTKWNGLSIREDAFYLFADEYFASYDLPAPLINMLTVSAAVAEIALPALLIVGLFTRAAAFGLLIMTLVIQVFVYPDAWWSAHAWWAIVLIVIVSSGPGAVSLDRRFKLD